MVDEQDESLAGADALPTMRDSVATEGATTRQRSEIGGPFGRYEDRGEVARGGMSVVHRSHDRLLLRSVAMKLLESDGASDAPLRFTEEAQIAGQLDHPNIVSVYDIGEADRGPYFTMKLVTGRTLTSVFRDLHDRRLDEREIERVLRIFLRVCDAVAFAHSRGVIHRDLKPDNVMVGEHGQVYVMDWGVALVRRIAKSPDAIDLERTSPAGNAEERGTIVGTIAMMAPEQARGRVDLTDERSDVYGLGSILYYLLTGRAPHAASTYEETLAIARLGAWEPPERRPAWPHVPPGLCDITKRALANDPGSRYPSVRALAADIETFLRGGGWFSTRFLTAGSTVVAEGDAADSAFIIIDGRCDVFRGSGPDRLRIRTLGPGAVFGETAVFAASRRTATVIALDDVTLRVVTGDAVERELGRSDWMRAFVRALASRFLEAEDKLTGRRRPSS